MPKLYYGFIFVFTLSLSLMARAEVEVVDAYQSGTVHLGKSLEQRLSQLERQLAAGQQLNLIAQVDALQEQVERLQGQVELQQHQLTLFKKQNSRVTAVAPQENVNVTPVEAEVNQISLSSQTSSIVFSEDPKADYQQIYDLLAKRDYAAARQGFVAYLSHYQESPFIVNAYYWLGELQLKQAEYQQALMSFAHVINDYPKSAKVADSLLKQGYIHYELAEWKLARLSLQQVKQNYPASVSARLAQKRLQQMNSQGL